jgi:hypothetical protein
MNRQTRRSVLRTLTLAVSESGRALTLQLA